MKKTSLLLCGSIPHLQRLLANQACDSLAIFQTNMDPLATVAPATLAGIGMAFLLHQPPGADACTTVRNLKRQYPALPVVALTEDYSGHTTKILLKCGADDVYPTKLTSEDLQTCLEAYLSGYGLAAPAPATHKKGRSTAAKAVTAIALPTLLAYGASDVSLPFQVPEPNAPSTQAQAIDHPYKGLEVMFFGAFKARYGGKAIVLSNQSKLLFAYLAYHHPKPLPKDHLAKVIWPEKYDYKPESARQSLNVEITRIRKAVMDQTRTDHNLIGYEKNFYRLNLREDLRSDVRDFKAQYNHIQQQSRLGRDTEGEQLAEAIRTFSGTFLSDFPEDAHNWIEVERQHLSAVFEQLADMRSAQLYDAGKYFEASAVCREILECDPRMESIHRRAICCHAKLGKQNLAELQYNLCVRMMDAEFQSEPSPETKRLIEQIRKGLFA
jgi:DNA-binding SARP family transcriptional activator/CheY-like chemotaxis protein